METIHISLLNLIFGLLLVAIPAALLAYYKTGLVQSMLISVGRMVLQLMMVGFYLHYLFAWNNVWINLAWLSVMICISALDLIKRTKMRLTAMLFPLLGTTFIALSLIVSYFLLVVLRMENFFDSQYFIPICGIVLGNMLSSNVIGLSSYIEGVSREQHYFNFLLNNGATLQEATKPLVRQALIKTFNPTIASMAVMGLIALPGTLIGQILGGNAPDTAVNYQIMIMVIIFASSILSVWMNVMCLSRRVFDEWGRPRMDALK